ncbi:hypothetical protein [Alicyclobacillus fodiniaquatilis]
MMMFKLAAKMHQLQQQGLSQREAATKLGLITPHGGLERIGRVKHRKSPSQ